MAGATGAMTGFAYPELLVKIVRRFHAGDLDGAAAAFYPYVPLMRFEFQEGIGMALRKEVLRRRGAIECADIRPPGAKLDAATPPRSTASSSGPTSDRYCTEYLARSANMATSTSNSPPPSRIIR